MTPAQRPPSAPAAPPSRLRRWGIRAAVALVLLAVAAWGAFTWMFFNPFEGRLDRLDRVIPASAGLALRGSAGEVLASPFVRERILGRAEIEDQLVRWGFEEGLARLREEQERLNARLPGILGAFDFRRDLLGRETAVFGTLRPGGGPNPLAKAVVATRLTGRARLILSVLKHEWARRRVEEQSGVKITRYPLLYEIDASSRVSDPEWALLWGALAKDVLIVGNDRALVTEAAHLASTGGGGSLPDRPDAGIAFSAAEAAPLRAWIDLARLSQDRSAAGLPSTGEASAALEGIPGFLGLLLAPDALATAQAVARFPSEDETVLELHGIRGEAALPVLPAAMAEGPARSGAEALKEAALLGPAGSAVAAARLEAPAGALFGALYGRLGADVRGEFEKWLRDGKTSIEEIGRELDDYLEPGVSVVVERLPECDSVALDRFGADEEGRFVLPLPGILLVARQRASAGEGAAERMLRRRLDGWKDQLSAYEDLADLPPGVRGFRFRPKFLTGEKELVRPAAAFEGDLVLLASNEGTLRRALEARQGKARDGGERPALSDFDGFEEAAARCGEGQGFAFVEAGAALKMLRDQRREAATGMVRKDWVEERRRIFRDVAIGAFQAREQVQQKAIEEEVDRRVEQAQRDQAEVDFPRAVERYLQILEPLKEVRSLALGLAWDSTGLRIRVVLRAEAR